VLLVVIGGTVLAHRQLTGSGAGPVTLPLPVPLQPPTEADHSSTKPSELPAGADADAARQGLRAAVEAGRLEPSQAEDARVVLSRAESALSADRAASGGDVALALAAAAAQASVYTGPRVRVLFSQLAVNLDHGPAPADLTDITGADGTVYRYMTGHGYVFHPLADFGRLNHDVSQGDTAATRQLTNALLARAVTHGDGLVWEYDFSFGGGPSRWTSGFAQAVAADSLYRAGLLLHDDRLKTAAHAAFAGLTAGLTRPVGGGRWVVEYSYSDMLVLNADLESLLALQRYAKLSGDPDAAELAAQFNDAAHALLPRFDTGCWSRYSLGGDPASPGYHAYHIELLRRLFAATHDPLWHETAARWDRYRRTPSC
jgi:hypothetical protein